MGIQHCGIRFCGRISKEHTIGFTLWVCMNVSKKTHRERVVFLMIDVKLTLVDLTHKVLN